MPLGIVLAASWLAMLSPKEIANEIQQSLDFLADEMGQVPERQRSIRAVMDDTWQRMTEAEQQVFMKLSVFRGGFTREAAQVVAGANLRTLMSLMNKSLLRRDADSGRYEVHELLRQYAAGQLDIAVETAAVDQAHSRYFLNWLAQQENDIKGARQVGVVLDIVSDFDNVRAAWEWAVEQEQFTWLDSAVECILWFCLYCPRYQDGLDLFGSVEQTTVSQSATPLFRVRLQTRKILFAGDGISSRIAYTTRSDQRFTGHCPIAQRSS